MPVHAHPSRAHQADCPCKRAPARWGPSRGCDAITEFRQDMLFDTRLLHSISAVLFRAKVMALLWTRRPGATLAHLQDTQAMSPSIGAARVQSDSLLAAKPVETAKRANMVTANGSIDTSRIARHDADNSCALACESLLCNPRGNGRPGHRRGCRRCYRARLATQCSQYTTWAQQDNFSIDIRSWQEHGASTRPL